MYLNFLQKLKKFFFENFFFLSYFIFTAKTKNNIGNFILWYNHFLSFDCLNASGNQERDEILKSSIVNSQQYFYAFLNWELQFSWDSE